MFISNEDKSIIMRILALFKPYKSKIAVILLTILASSGISMILPLITKRITDNGLIGKNFSIVVQMALFSVLLVLLDQVLGLLETKYRTYINSMMSYNLANSVFRHLLKVKVQFFNRTNPTQIINNIKMDVSNVSRVSDRSTFFIVMQIFRIIGGVIGLLLISWQLTIAVLCMIPAKIFIVKYIAKNRRKVFQQYMKNDMEYAAFLGDSVSGVKEIKAWGLDHIMEGQFVKKYRNIVKSNIQLSYMDKLNELSEILLINIVTNALYILGAYLIFNVNLTIGGLFAFITYSVYVTTPISGLLNLGYSFASILPSAKRLFELLDMEQERNITSEKPFELDFDAVKGCIEFENVAFSYEPGKPVLNGVSFRVKPGEKVALIGINGSGKSTVFSLLQRFYTPEHGRILLDGADISHIPLKSYRSLISVVSQSTYLFNTTIKENITLYSKMDEKAIRKASSQSQAHEFIQAMSNQYDSRVGMNGAQLSGGQRQKIAMARAMARNSRIMLLDEATSNYDMESEMLVNNFLKTNLENKTVIIISHRPETLKMADRILMLENGVIKDAGTHEELYKRNFTYREMLNTQTDLQRAGAG